MPPTTAVRIVASVSVFDTGTAAADDQRKRHLDRPVASGA